MDGGPLCVRIQSGGREHSCRRGSDEGGGLVFNERQSVDLTPYLRGFDGDEISLELDLHIGRELEIGGPVIIPDWEDTPETEFP